MEEPIKQSLSDIIKNAGDKQIVIIGAGAETGHHAALIAKLRETQDVILVAVEDLNEEDQKKVSEAKAFESPRGSMEELALKMTIQLRHEVEHLPDNIILNEDNKTFHHTKPTTHKSFNTKGKVHLPKKMLGFRGRR
jgi:hypothetical protein